VDLIGIEPMTSSMPWKRAPSCATGPQTGGLPLFCWEHAQFVKRSLWSNRRLTVVAEEKRTPSLLPDEDPRLHPHVLQRLLWCLVPSSC
jgi:hypothetical protein